LAARSRGLIRGVEQQKCWARHPGRARSAEVRVVFAKIEALRGGSGRRSTHRRAGPRMLALARVRSPG